MLEFVGGDQPASVTSGTILATVHPGSSFDSLITVGLPSALIMIDGKSVATDSLGNWSFDNGGSGTSPFSTAFAGPHGSVVRHDGANDTLRSSLGKTNILMWNDY